MSMNLLQKLLGDAMRNDLSALGQIPKEPPTQEEPLEPIPQEILAWRGWRLAQDAQGPVLKSAGRDTLWLGPTLVADAVPASQTGNGIYALPNENDGQQYHSSSAVWGQVALSGIVVVAEAGYRAERATIRSLEILLPPPELGALCLLELAEALEQRYKCSVAFDPVAIYERRQENSGWQRVSQIRVVTSVSTQSALTHLEAYF